MKYTHTPPLIYMCVTPEKIIIIIIINFCYFINKFVINYTYISFYTDIDNLEIIDNENDKQKHLMIP